MSEEDDWLKKEFSSWKSFSNHLRSDERELFKRMLRECNNYSHAIGSSGKSSASEPLFMTILLVQHRMIQWLSSELAKIRGEEKKLD